MAIEFLRKLAFLFEPARLKIIYGGRGAGKTEGASTALPVFANHKKLRILCSREFQNSLAQSSYQTLVNCINSASLADTFQIQATRIVSKLTGSEFLFAGLRHNIESIKSLAKIDINWTDEARNISKTSLDKLGPTIRGRHENDPAGMGGPFGLGPELWFTFNPELEDDEIYKRYVIKRQQYAPDFITGEVDLEDQKFYYSVKEKIDNSIDIDYLTALEKQRYQHIRNKRYAFVVKVNHDDNKFFPPDLRREMILLKEANEDDYLHVWEGNTKQVLDGAIYAEEIKKVLKEKRKGEVKYDSSRVVHTFWDLGHDDYTSIWFVQQVGIEYNLIAFYQDRLKKIPFYIQHLQSLGYNYGYHYLPHDGDNETLAGRSTAKILRDSYPGKVKIVPRVAKKVHGIRAARVIFDLCNFDEENTADGWQCLCNYQYKVDEDTGTFSKEPLHNEFSHGCFTADTEILTSKGLKAINALPETGEAWTLLGWKKFLNPHLTRKNAPLVEVLFTNGSTVKCTPDHLFLTTANEWKSAESLTKDLVIQSGLKQTSNILIESSIEKINLVIIHVLANFTEKFGKKLLVKYLKTATYITEMKINQIINYTILNVFLKTNICHTLLFANGRTADLLGFPKTQDKQQQFGINHQKAELGMFNKPLLCGQNKRNIANTVGKLLKHYRNKNTVALNVLNQITLKIEHIKQSLFTKKIRFVLSATINLFKSFKEVVRTSFFAQQNVGNLTIKSVKILSDRQDVWCLTVPDCGHFALANGAIVKNCDAFQTFATSLKSETQMKKPPKTVGAGVIRPAFRPGNNWMGG